MKDKNFNQKKRWKMKFEFIITINLGYEFLLYFDLKAITFILNL